MLYRDMLVETPYSLADVEDRRIQAGNENRGQCTYCKASGAEIWHRVEDLTVYRVWTADSIYRPNSPGKHEQGGAWQWRCLDHSKRAWAPHSHSAPQELLPPAVHECEQIDVLAKSRCAVAKGTRQFEEGWFCSDHSLDYELRGKARRLLSDEDPEAGEGR